MPAAIADAGAFRGGHRGYGGAAGSPDHASQIAIPTIGIGASVDCDGQILVLEDMLGLSPRVPKFVKEFGNLGAAIEKLCQAICQRGQDPEVPAREHVYGMKKSKAAPLKKTALEKK